MAVAASPVPELDSVSFEGLSVSLDEDIAQVRAESMQSSSPQCTTKSWLNKSSRETDQTSQIVDLVPTVLDQDTESTLHTDSPWAI